MSPLRRSILRGIALTGALWLCGSAAAPARGMTPRDLLRKVAEFTDADWAMVERGEAVAKSSRPTPAKSLSPGPFASSVSAISSSPGPRIWRSSRGAPRSSIRAGSARSRALRPSARHLRGSQPRSAQLPSRGLPRPARRRRHRALSQGSQLAGADWRNQSARVWREVLARYAAAYLSNGRKALPDYVNKREALSVASEVSVLTSEFGFVSSYSPELAAYLHDFGPNPPAGAQHMLYWTSEDFGIRPIFRISHQVIFRAAGSTPSTLIATNQVYADHYLDAALTVTMALERRVNRGGCGAGPRLLHDLGEPRPDPLAERLLRRFAAFDGPEPQPRGHAKNPGLDQGGHRKPPNLKVSCRDPTDDMNEEVPWVCR